MFISGGSLFVIAKKEASTSKRKILLYREGHSLKASEGLEDKKKGPKKVGRNGKKHDVWTWWKYGRCVKRENLQFSRTCQKFFFKSLGG